MDRWRLLVGLTVLLAAVVAPTRSPAQDKPAKLRAVLWVGGFAHDFDAFAAIITEFLPKRVPIELEVVRDGSFLDAPTADQLDAIVMNHCFESAKGVLTEAQEQKLLGLVRGGVGVVAIHASYYSFLDWEAIRELYGARFTQHGSSEINVVARMVDRSHPITRNLPETFTVRTELYESTPLAEDCHVLAMAHEEGSDREHPSVWTRLYGKGRVVTILPAHWPDSYRVEAFQQLIANSVLWAGHRDPPEAPQEKP
jgi:type 1 glutamine amidotransferase